MAREGGGGGRKGGCCVRERAAKSGSGEGNAATAEPARLGHGRTGRGTKSNPSASETEKGNGRRAGKKRVNEREEDEGMTFCDPLVPRELSSQQGRPLLVRMAREGGGGGRKGGCCVVCVGGSAVPADSTLRAARTCRKVRVGGRERGNGRTCAPGPRKDRKGDQKQPKQSEAHRAKGPREGALTGPEDPTQEQGRQRKKGKRRRGGEEYKKMYANERGEEHHCRGSGVKTPREKQKDVGEMTNVEERASVVKADFIVETATKGTKGHEVGRKDRQGCNLQELMWMGIEAAQRKAKRKEGGHEARSKGGDHDALTTSVGKVKGKKPSKSDFRSDDRVKEMRKARPREVAEQDWLRTAGAVDKACVDVHHKNKSGRP
ncbi:hypothetical protein C8R47DRAFT_1063183 [Mycena vitilis]|nr:hypothetical protein C8R47DRAFT_1063183 [Mycena vitilis]